MRRQPERERGAGAFVVPAREPAVPLATARRARRRALAALRRTDPRGWRDAP